MRKMKILCAAFAIGAISSSAMAARHGCSIEALEGAFGLSTRGNLLDGGQALGVYRIAFDGHGGLLIDGSMSINGRIVHDRKRTGRYTLDANCAGRVEMHSGTEGAFPSGFLVLEADMNKLRFVGTDPALVLEATGRRQFARIVPRPCQTSDLVGDFGSTGGGFIIGQGPVIGNGVMTFDGAGGMTLVRNFNAAGKILQDDHVTGRYEINADCTGTLTYLPRNKLMKDGDQVHDLLIVDDDLNSFRIVGQDPGRVLVVDASKQHHNSEDRKIR